MVKFDDSLNLLREYVGGVSVWFGSESFYYHYDRLGSVRFISDSGGSVVCDYVYDAFGNILSSSGNLNQPYEYVGREGYYREEFDLYLLGVRWYDSEAGRFISRDPIRLKNILNYYEYCYNNPLVYLDLEGKFGLIILLPGSIYLYWCRNHARQIFEQLNTIEDNHLRHCIASCKLAEETDEFCAEIAGLWNEIRPGRSGRSGFAEDMQSNRIGLGCYREIQERCSTGRQYKSCEECCRENRP